MTKFTTQRKDTETVVSAGHGCTPPSLWDAVNLGLAEIFSWFDQVRRRALMQSGVVTVAPPVEKIKESKEDYLLILQETLHQAEVGP